MIDPSILNPPSLTQHTQMSLLRGVRRAAQPVECVTNSGKDNKHGSVTLAFETECVHLRN